MTLTFYMLVILLKKINKTINFDLSNLLQWLKAKKISLNVNKTELVIFRSSKKQIYKNLNFLLIVQKIKPKHHTKYLGVILDEYLAFNEYMNTLKQKLNRANGILAKLRCYLSADILKTIYNALDMIPSTQNKALRIINFKQWNCVNLYIKTSKYMSEKIISY